jgi:hypothetical protein
VWSYQTLTTSSSAIMMTDAVGRSDDTGNLPAPAMRTSRLAVAAGIQMI